MRDERDWDEPPAADSVILFVQLLFRLSVDLFQA